MKKKLIVITTLIVIISFFAKFTPNIKTLIEINQFEKAEQDYSKNCDDILLAKLVFESADKQYYYKLQEYGEIFFEKRNPYSACNFLEEYLLLNNNVIMKNYDSIEELYDLILWQYLITYFYDSDTNSITNITLFLNKYDKLEDHFIAEYEKGFEKFSNGIICTDFFKESESLKIKLLNALNLHWLISNTTNAYNTVLFSGLNANESKQKDLYMDVILFESGNDLWRTNHITVSNDLDNSIVCRSSIELIERNSDISEIADYFKVNLELSQLQSQDIFVFTTNQYAYVFFGKNASIFMCYDLINGDLIEYKS